MKKLSFLLVLSLLAVSGSFASPKSTKSFEVTGNHLSQFCSVKKKYTKGVCLGYVNGVAALQKTACIPEGVKFGQLRAVVVRYMKENPERLHTPAKKIIVSALAQAWPCK